MKRVSKPKKEVKTQKKRKQYKSVPLRIEKPTGSDKALYFILIPIFKFLSYVLVFFLGAFATLCIMSAVGALLYIRIVSTHSGIPTRDLIQLAQGARKSSRGIEPRTNFLILGTDSLENRDTESKLTDTIMIISVEPNTGKLTTFSLPRDLWVASQSAKINSLYAKQETSKQSLVTPIVGDMTGLTIDRVVVMDIITVGKLIDAFGGLEVEVERSFVDHKFPRSDVDVKVVRDPALLYETIAFSKGMEHMSGDRALRYIRSRHSLDPIEGSDDARVKRQQRVITALLAKMKDPMIVRNPEQIGRILQIYRSDIESSLPLREAVTLGWQFVENRQFPVLESRQFAGAFQHPARFPGGAWVYLPVDPTYTQIREQVSQWMQNTPGEL